ncbi:MAG: DUF4364 family protein [Oscillospiraceae bacterium]|jgi:hypothetical protein|nr:DUF4364 family protein [Oscillospiraceae bacterium]
MALRYPSPEELKLCVLYALRALVSASSNQLLTFFNETGTMNYLEMQSTLTNLLDGAQVLETQAKFGVTYSLSAEGSDSLKLFEKMIPPSSREAIDKAAEVWRVKFETERQVFHKIIKAEPGAVTVVLSVMDGDEPLMELSLRVPDMGSADLIGESWEGRAADVYSVIMKLLAAR